MRFIIIFIFILLNANELQITKYITNKNPKIYVEYLNSNNKINSLLKIDSNIISHYKLEGFKKISSLTDTNLDKYTGYDYLLRFKYENNKLVALLYDLLSKKVLIYKQYKIPNFNLYPFLVHSLSYDINSALNFIPVPWIKRKIVYSVNIAPKENDIFIADITLKYRKKIIAGGMNIFPKWVDKNQTSIYYTKFLNKPTLLKYNLRTGKTTKILSSEGMLVVSDVKGDNLLLTLALNDQPDIYEYNLNSKKLKRLTTYPGIDVSGKFYGDDILFISDRLGNPNVYKKNLKTDIISKVIYYSKNQISFTTYKDNIVISTRETNKAFAKNTFNLLLVKKNSFDVKRLTMTGKNIYPVFSNDGSTILFIKQNNFNSKLGIIRLKENKIFYFKLNRVLQSFDF